MLYFLNLDGTMTLAEPQRVFQGSNNVNTVYVLSAIAPPTALEISFTLPSGLTTAYYPMIYNGATDEYTVPNTTTTVYLRSFLLTSNITAEVGTVGVSVNAVYSNADGTTGNQTSFTGSFNVEYSSIPETVTTGTADELQQALDLLSQYYTQQQSIITGGTNGEYLQSQGDNQLPVWTSFDMDFVAVNRAQSLSNAQKAQARTNIGAEGSADSQYTVKVIKQTFTEEQKTQARTNIRALSSADLSVWAQRTDTEEDLNILANAKRGQAYISRFSPNTANAPDGYGSVTSFRNIAGETAQFAVNVPYGHIFYRVADSGAELGSWQQVDTIKAQSSNYIVYTSGLKIQWGTRNFPIDVAPGGSISQTINLPIAMTTTNYQAFGTAERSHLNYYPAAKKASSFVLDGLNVGANTAFTAYVYTWIVIGY